MQVSWTLPVLFGILIIGFAGFSQDAFAEPITLFPTFVGSFSVSAQEIFPKGLAFSSDGTKMFVVGGDGDDINEYIISIPICSPPPSGDWVVETTCTLSLSPSNPSINNGDLIVQNNSVLTIPAGVSLNIDFTNHNLTVKSGSGILIKAGGTIT